jgi:uncharacterized protein (DUF58 family)
MIPGLGPPRVGRGVVLLIALSAAFFGIARTTGAGWIVVLLCALVGCVVVSFGAPLPSLRLAALRARAPRDGTVGQSSQLELSVFSGGSSLKVRALDPTSEWVSADPPAAGELFVTPARRGVLEAVEVEVESGSPLGLVRWRRKLRLPLAVPMEVGPRPIEGSTADLLSAGHIGSTTELRGRLGHESVRGVRDYVAGDPIRAVHWPATAHRGYLMVKELEDPDVPRLTLVVDLRGHADLAEVVASRAAGLVIDALGRGLSVTVVTAERSGGVIGEVLSPLEAGRRLARAVAAAPPDGPLPAGSVVVRLSVSTIRAERR